MSTAQDERVNRFVSDFHQSGFGVIRKAVEPEVTEELRTHLDTWFEPRPPRHAVPRQRLLPRIVERHERFAGLAASPPLVATLESIFGVVPQLVCSYGHEKPAKTAAHTVPHSDVAHLPGVPHHLSMLMVKAMCSLTPVDPGSGATMVFPGSHRMPEASGHTIADEEAGHKILLDPGDLFLFHSNLRHTATKNSTTNPRLSVWFVVCAAVDAGVSGLRVQRQIPCRPAAAPGIRAVPEVDLRAERPVRHRSFLTGGDAHGVPELNASQPRHCTAPL
jgi:hypothetical protein